MDDLIRKQTVLNMIDDVQFGNITQKLSQLYEAVRNYPSVDAVEVIRCKDCKNWDTKRTLVFMCYCSELNRWTGDDYYCASGERKEEENNEIS